ncbi:MAG: hypothetical protein R3362_12905, partial [Rhodothermales bacterium]|nr:hypothetical protein [Rhodothermales bacterium]
MTAAENPHQPPAAPTPAVDALLRTLADEEAALVALGDALTEGLAALSAREHERFQASTDAAADAVSALARLRPARERQMRLLGRVLGTEPTDAVEP